jgi:mediator of RNA polymerase II transcription subunit 14
VDRYGRDGPKSWIILGVHSGRKNGKVPDEKTASKISLRWFRDGKEVKEHEIPLKLDEISAEDLIKYVITQHILHILSSTHSKLREKPLFKSRELALRLGSAPEDAKELELSVQLSTSHQITITIEPMTGRFAFSPGSRIVTHFEAQLNSKAQDPSLKAHEFIENLRCALVTDEVINRAVSVGWTRTTNPGIKADELKPIFPRDTAQLSWFRRAGWDQDWIVAFSSSMSGDRWWLIQTYVYFFDDSLFSMANTLTVVCLAHRLS